MTNQFHPHHPKLCFYTKVFPFINIQVPLDMNLVYLTLEGHLFYPYHNSIGGLNTNILMLKFLPMVPTHREDKTASN